MESMIKPKIAPLSGQELHEFVKQLLGLKGGFELLEIPEATVLSVYDVYTWHKWMYTWHGENDHYEAVVRSRQYPQQQEQYLLDKVSKIKNITITDFVRLILEAENQILSERQIDLLFNKYDETRGRVYKAYNEKQKVDGERSKKDTEKKLFWERFFTVLLPGAVFLELKNDIGFLYAFSIAIVIGALMQVIFTIYNAKNDK